MGRWFQSLWARKIKVWMSVLLLIGIVTAVISREVEKRKTLAEVRGETPTGVPAGNPEPPPNREARERTETPLKDSPPSSSTPQGRTADYELIPSPKGTVKLKINGKESLFLVSDLNPFPCPGKADQMCLLLNSGSYIEVTPELRKKLPVEYQYFLQH